MVGGGQLPPDRFNHRAQPLLPEYPQDRSAQENLDSTTRWVVTMKQKRKRAKGKIKSSRTQSLLNRPKAARKILESSSPGKEGLVSARREFAIV